MFERVMVVVVMVSLLFAVSIAQAVDKKEETKPAQTKSDAKADAKQDQKAQASAQKEDKGKKPADSKASKDAKGGLIDINTATKDELKTIPGIGDAYAEKIIANRPYKKKDQLKSKKIIPENVYESIKDKIVAKQPAK